MIDKSTKLALFVMALFATISLLQPASGAQLPKARTIKVPTQYGKVVEISDERPKTNESGAKRSLPEGDQRLIIHIQDLHTNYEAQKNTVAILEELIKKHGVKLVLHEGGCGDDSLVYLRQGVSLQKRRDVAERYMKVGMMTAAEYLNLASDYDFKIYGIEDSELYDEHMESFLEVERLKEPASDLLNRFKAVVNLLKEKLYSRAILALEEKERGYEEKKITFQEYISYMASLIKKVKLDLSPYPDFAKFLDVVSLESRLDYTQIESERAQAIDALTKVLDKKSLDSLVSKSLDFKSGKISQADYYRQLEAISKSNGVNLSNYPSFSSYIRYLKSADGMDNSKVFSEMGKATEALKQTYLKTEAQKRLYQVDKDIAILDNLLNIHLNPDDYAYLEKNAQNFKTASWCEFLNAQVAKYKIPARVPVDASDLDSNFEKFVKFYKLARERDVAFVKNAKKWMDEQNQNVAALVAGGFHTPNLLYLFKEGGISYAVIAPKVTKELDEALYHSALKKKWTPGDWPDR